MSSLLRPTRREFLAAGAAASALAGLTVSARAQDTMETIKQSGTVRVGIANERPYGYVEPDGTLAGAIPAIVLAALQSHGVTKLDAQIVEFNALIPGLNANRFDIVAAGMYINPKRCQAISFTNPVSRAGYGFAALAGNPKKLHSVADLVASADAKAGTQTGSSQVDVLTKAGLSSDRMVLFANATEALAGLRAGRVDVIYFPSLELGELLATAKDASVERVLPFEQMTTADGKPDYGYAGLGVRKSDTALLQTLNTELAAMIANGKLLETIKPYGYGSDDLPTQGVTTETLCAG